MEFLDCVYLDFTRLFKSLNCYQIESRQILRWNHNVCRKVNLTCQLLVWNWFMFFYKFKTIIVSRFLRDFAISLFRLSWRHSITLELFWEKCFRKWSLSMDWKNEFMIIIPLCLDFMYVYVKINVMYLNGKSFKYIIEYTLII